MGRVNRERLREELRPADTDPKTWAVYLDLLKRMTPGERFRTTLELTDLVLALSDAGKKHDRRKRASAAY